MANSDEFWQQDRKFVTSLFTKDKSSDFFVNEKILE